MAQVTMELSDLQDLLNKQKRITGEYITRNLTVYHWADRDEKLSIDKAKTELREECAKSGYPTEFDTLKKYLK